MATPDTTTEPEVPDDPLEMARNLLAHLRAAVAYSASPDPEKQIMSHINRVGAQAYQDSEVAGRLALVSIAEDVRRVADHLAGSGPERFYTISYRELSTGLRETAPERYVTLGEAVEAYRAMRRDDRDAQQYNGLPSSDPRVEYDGRPVDLETPVVP